MSQLFCQSSGKNMEVLLSNKVYVGCFILMLKLSSSLTFHVAKSFARRAIHNSLIVSLFEAWRIRSKNRRLRGDLTTEFFTLYVTIYYIPILTFDLPKESSILRLSRLSYMWPKIPQTSCRFSWANFEIFLCNKFYVGRFTLMLRWSSSLSCHVAKSFVQFKLQNSPKNIWFETWQSLYKDKFTKTSYDRVLYLPFMDKMLSSLMRFLKTSTILVISLYVIMYYSLVLRYILGNKVRRFSWMLWLSSSLHCHELRPFVRHALHRTHCKSVDLKLDTFAS